MNFEKNITVFKNISIRGRLAYALICFDLFLQKKHSEICNNRWILYYLNLVWEVVSAENIYLLEKKLTELAPNSILDKHPNNKFDKYEYFKLNELIEIRELYEILPISIISIMDSIIEISFSNLYSSTGEFSKSTLEELEYIFHVLENEKFDLPELPINILNSSFKEKRGWGDIKDLSLLRPPR